MSSMIIVMKPDATQEDVDQVLARLAAIDSEAHVSVGQKHTVIGVIGDRERIQQLPWEALSGVER
ncbi:MAG: 3-deoxy-7-phosphoheptulonate synthase, partial [Acidimicrobiia bacterium]